MLLDQWWIYTDEMYNARMIDWYRQQYAALEMTPRVVLCLYNASSRDTVFPARSYELCDSRWLFRASSEKYFTLAENKNI